MIRENTPKVKKNKAYGVIPDKIAPTVSVTATEPEYEAVEPKNHGYLYVLLVVLHMQSEEASVWLRGSTACLGMNPP